MRLPKGRLGDIIIVGVEIKVSFVTFASLKAVEVRKLYETNNKMSNGSKFDQAD